MKKILKNSINSTTLVLAPLFIGVFIIGTVVGAKGIGSQLLPASVSASLYANAPEGVNLDPVWKVWHILDERFVSSVGNKDVLVKELTSSTPIATTSTTTSEIEKEAPLTEAEKMQKKVWGLAQGLAASVDDPYTVFMPPSDAEMFADDISGEFEGVGMEIGIRDGILTVVSPLKGTPAYKADMQAKDKIFKIDGVSTKNMSVNTAVKKIRGPKGTVVTFDVLREGEGLLERKVTRGVIEIPTIKTETLPTGEFVIELLHFSANSPELFRDALLEFQKKGGKKLILDLRGNPGGYLGAAVNMASWFLPKGDIVVTEDYGKSGKKTEHRSKGMDIFTDDLELAILVDKGSASASEILAGALKEHGIATLIGTNTFGKGSVQELVKITPDTSLKVTVALWLLPNDVHITKEGIEPDVLVDFKKILEERGKEAFKEGEDIIRDRAVEWFKTGK